MGFLYTQRHFQREKYSKKKGGKPLREYYSKEELAPYQAVLSTSLEDFTPPEKEREIKLVKYVITSELTLVRLRLNDVRRYRQPENLAAEQARLNNLIKQIKQRLLQIEQINANADELLALNESALSTGIEKLVKCWEKEKELGLKTSLPREARGAKTIRERKSRGSTSAVNAELAMRQQSNVERLKAKGFSEAEAREMLGMD